MFLRRIVKNKLAFGGGVIVLLFIIVAVLAPVISPYNPAHIDVGKILLPPSKAHPFGTD